MAPRRDMNLTPSLNAALSANTPAARNRREPDDVTKLQTTCRVLNGLLGTYRRWDTLSGGGSESHSLRICRGSLGAQQSGRLDGDSSLRCKSAWARGARADAREVRFQELRLYAS